MQRRRVAAGKTAEREIAILKKTADKDKAEKSEELRQVVVDEEQQLEIDLLKSKLTELNNKIDRDSNIHDWRKYGLISLFALIVLWLLVICYFLHKSGYDPSGFPKIKLSDQVLMTLIGTTTVNVFMLLNIAARWLYGNPKSDKSK